MHNLVTIRLKRLGCFKYPVYNIVVMYKYKRAKGRFIEKLGYYNPQNSENFFVINFLRLGFWLNKGAKLNIKVIKYLAKFLVLKIYTKMKKKNSKKKIVKKS